MTRGKLPARNTAAVRYQDSYRLPTERHGAVADANYRLPDRGTDDDHDVSEDRLLLMMIIRGAQGQLDTATGPRAMDSDPLHAQAASMFADELAAARVPSVRIIRAGLYVGQPRAQRIRGSRLGQLHDGLSPRKGIESWRREVPEKDA